MSDQNISEEQFSSWQAAHQDDVAIAQKPDEERSQAEEDQYDIFVDEIRKVIPGSDKLSAEQLRGLAINLDLGSTRHAGGQIRSLNDATNYVGERTQEAGRGPGELEQDMIRDNKAASGILSEGYTQGVYHPDHEPVTPAQTPSHGRGGKDGLER